MLPNIAAIVIIQAIGQPPLYCTSNTVCLPMAQAAEHSGDHLRTIRFGERELTSEMGGKRTLDQQQIVMRLERSSLDVGAIGPRPDERFALERQKLREFLIRVVQRFPGDVKLRG